MSQAPVLAAVITASVALLVGLVNVSEMVPTPGAPRGRNAAWQRHDGEVAPGTGALRPASAALTPPMASARVADTPVAGRERP